MVQKWHWEPTDALRKQKQKTETAQKQLVSVFQTRKLVSNRGKEASTQHTRKKPEKNFVTCLKMAHDTVADQASIWFLLKAVKAVSRRLEKVDDMVQTLWNDTESQSNAWPATFCSYKVWIGRPSSTSSCTKRAAAAFRIVVAAQPRPLSHGHES